MFPIFCFFSYVTGHFAVGEHRTRQHELPQKPNSMRGNICLPPPPLFFLNFFFALASTIA